MLSLSPSCERVLSTCCLRRWVLLLRLQPASQPVKQIALVLAHAALLMQCCSCSVGPCRSTRKVDFAFGEAREVGDSLPLLRVLGFQPAASCVCAGSWLLMSVLQCTMYQQLMHHVIIAVNMFRDVVLHVLQQLYMCNWQFVSINASTHACRMTLLHWPHLGTPSSILCQKECVLRQCR